MPAELQADVSKSVHRRCESQLDRESATLRPGRWPYRLTYGSTDGTQPKEPQNPD